MKSTKQEAQEITVDIIEKSSDGGKLIEVGWIAFSAVVIPETASKAQYDAMRQAFFAGAHHLFQSIVCVLDAETEPTEQDIKRMDLIYTELEEFIINENLKYSVAEGNA